MGKDREQMQLSYTADGSVRWHGLFEEPCDNFFKVKHSSLVGPSNSPLKHLLKRNENICSAKGLYKNVCSSLFIIAPEWKQSKCPSTGE